MKALNLYSLSTVRDNKLFSRYEAVLSGRAEVKKTKEYEQKSLFTLVDSLIGNGVDINELDGFYFSYTINHISKEFDLLKFSADKECILNIELKSHPKSVEEYEKQLLRNRYYLGHITKNVLSYTYVSETQELFYINEEEKLETASFGKLVKDIKNFGVYYDENIDRLFRASNYLISPLNTPDKFLGKDYFLTAQQEEFKDKILNSIDEGTEKVFSVKGAAGTGKTLLLYDIACELAKKYKVCIIHCGIICEGHNYLNEKLQNVTIVPIKAFSNIIDTDYGTVNYINNADIIMADESHRMYRTQFDNIINCINASDKRVIFFHDAQQMLSTTEENRNIAESIEAVSDQKHALSLKIRTNRELGSFIRALFNQKFKDTKYKYDLVDIVYAPTTEAVFAYLKHYCYKGYSFINYTESQYYKGAFDVYKSELNTHKVIGQEFDNVVMIMGDYFKYEEGRLIAKKHPNPDYLYRKLLFQGVTRARERLCLIVDKNEALFADLIKLKEFE